MVRGYGLDLRERHPSAAGNALEQRAPGARATPKVGNSQSLVNEHAERVWIWPAKTPRQRTRFVIAGRCSAIVPSPAGPVTRIGCLASMRLDNGTRA